MKNVAPRLRIRSRASASAPGCTCNDGIALRHCEAAARKEVALHVDNEQRVAVPKPKLPGKLGCACRPGRHAAPTAFAKPGSLWRSAAATTDIVRSTLVGFTLMDSMPCPTRKLATCG